MNFWSFISNPDRWIRGHIRRGVKQALFGDVIAEYKGERGEHKASNAAGKALAGHNAISMCDVYLPWPDGRTAQIDQIIIADSGIYVLEVKNYKGWIFGNEKNQYWTQVLSSGYFGQSIKNRLYNPIRQNASHVYCIRKNLKGYKGPIHSLIVFSNEAEFKDIKDITVYSSDVYVLNQSRIHDVFQLIADKHKNCLTADEIQDIKAQLYQVAIPADEKRHAENIKMHIADQEDKLEKGICPRCGANLVLRTVKKGNNAGASFIACSRYPECKYTHSL